MGFSGAALGHGLGNFVTQYMNEKHRRRMEEKEDRRYELEKRRQKANEVSQGLDPSYFDENDGGYLAEPVINKPQTQGLLSQEPAPSVGMLSQAPVAEQGILTKSPFAPWKQKQIAVQEKSSQLALDQYDPQSSISKNIHQLARNLYNESSAGLGDQLFGPNEMSAAEIEKMLPYVQKYDQTAAAKLNSAMAGLRTEAQLQNYQRQGLLAEQNLQLKKDTLEESKRRTNVLAGIQRDKLNKTKEPTQDAKKVAGYANRLLESEKIFQSVAESGYDASTLKNKALKATPDVIRGLLPSGMIPDQALLQEQAERDFINAVLRRESGAVISDKEFSNAEKQYFPRPGDSVAVLKQKENNRKQVLQNYMDEAGTAYKGGQIPRQTNYPKKQSASSSLEKDPKIERFAKDNGIQYDQAVQVLRKRGYGK